MIDEQLIQWMARKFEMNPEKARKLLKLARTEPAIVRLSRKYAERCKK